MPETQRYRSHALRVGRVSESGRVYLVTTATYGREPLFRDWTAGRLVVRELRCASARTLAFVVMPDHLHWLMEVSEVSLSRVVGAFKSRSSRRINAHLGRCGRVWQPGFHDHAVRRDEDMLGIARYVVSNPCRAGIVRRLGDYPLWDAIWV